MIARAAAAGVGANYGFRSGMSRARPPATPYPAGRREIALEASCLATAKLGEP